MHNHNFHRCVGVLTLVAAVSAGCSESSSNPPAPANPNPAATNSATQDGESLEQLFETPEQALDSFVAALRSFDRDALGRIFGANAANLIESGDEVADRHTVEEFLSLYDARHTLTPESDGVVSLIVGDNDWPFPIPLVKDEAENAWYFDTAAGMEEIINRRVGRNELDAIQVCLAIVDAQREYALLDPDGDGVRNYARKVRSQAGQKDGLYWESAEGETPSPMGPMFAEAAREGYDVGPSESATPRPYHGYCYRLVTSQGPDAPGGELDYLVNDKLVGGFALVAYPAEYGASGIMTFIVNHEGTVYQRDLGDDTEAAAAGMNTFNPDATWQKAEIPTPAQP